MNPSECVFCGTTLSEDFSIHVTKRENVQQFKRLPGGPTTLEPIPIEFVFGAHEECWKHERDNEEWILCPVTEGGIFVP